MAGWVPLPICAGRCNPGAQGTPGCQEKRKQQLSEISIPQGILHTFHQSVDRPYLPFIPADESRPILHLGPGSKHMHGTVELEYPDWNAEADAIPFEDDEVGGIFAYHFFEHLADPRPVLRECSRVLAVGSPLTLAVPHYLGTSAFQDLDHKSFWTADTLKTLLDDSRYSKGKGGLNFLIQFNYIIGLVERNQMLVAQLVKI